MWPWPPSAAAESPPPSAPQLSPPVPGAVVAPFSPPGHRGVDLRAPAGQAVLAPVAGSVTFAGQVGGHLWVTVSPEAEVRVSLGWMTSLAVEPGQSVVAGQLLGTAAGQAHDTGPADVLHVSVRLRRAYVDPAPLLGLPSTADKPRLIPEGTQPEPADNDSPDAVIDDALALGRAIGQSAGAAAIQLGPATSIALGPPYSIDRSAGGLSIERLFGSQDSATWPPRYVAFGDSITTGFSVAACDVDADDRGKNGCGKGRPPATAYPELVAVARGLSPVERVGYWGRTAKDEADAYRSSSPSGQLVTAEAATTLVTGALGINDLKFSHVSDWIWVKAKGRLVPTADMMIRNIASELDTVFAALAKARDHGAHVIITLYYNPYDSAESCRYVADIGEVIVSRINAELEQRAEASGLDFVDLHAKFRGHGPGEKSWVFAQTCSAAVQVKASLGTALALCALCSKVAHKVWRAADPEVLFDPHPNAAGGRAIAEAILEKLR